MQDKVLKMALIGVGNMGKKYAQMIVSGEVLHMKLAAVVIRRDEQIAWGKLHPIQSSVHTFSPYFLHLSVPFLILYPAYFPPSFLIYIIYIPIFLFLNPFHITSYTFSRLYCLFQQYSGIRICNCIFHAVRCRRFIPII